MTETTTTSADAAKKQHEATKKRLAEERAAREKQQASAREATANVKPTPTQAECDLAKSGVPVLEKEDDGSGPDPYSAAAMEAAKPAGQSGSGYPTRNMQPQSQPQPQPAASRRHSDT